MATLPFEHLLRASNDTEKDLLHHYDPYLDEADSEVGKGEGEGEMQKTPSDALAESTSLPSPDTLSVKLELADIYRDVPAFYLPHSVDFRGRAYPIPPYLSIGGNDISRGLGHPLNITSSFYSSTRYNNFIYYNQISVLLPYIYCSPIKVFSVPPPG
jgi:hypothetical protein